MKKGCIKAAVALTVIAVGLVCLGKKTGFFENDSHLYDEFES
ncbi:methanol dehydrogenase [Enterococcus hirae]|nr:methanol dehydrogenase [Enterococcus hirae]